jgi:hypothetical protein
LYCAIVVGILYYKKPAVMLLGEKELKDMERYITNEERDRLHYISFIKKLDFQVYFLCCDFKLKLELILVSFPIAHSLPCHRT